MEPSQLPPVPAVSAMEAALLLADGDAVLIDVRDPEEWAQATIPKAEFRPMSTINDWYGRLPRDTTVIVYCKTGARSHAVVHALSTQAGFTNAVNLEGGIVAWAADDLPVESSASH
ncbi:MAG: rhodanese-like domain-containing protein [Acidimicrobiia bacterium]